MLKYMFFGEVNNLHRLRACIKMQFEHVASMSSYKSFQYTVRVTTHSASGPTLRPVTYT